MVLCSEVFPDDDCRTKVDERNTPFKCQMQEEPYDCTKIVGCDHLKKKRARKFRCRSKRIKQLAEPKYFSQKFSEEEYVNCKKAVEVIRENEEQLPVRIKLLAYPKVRKLVSSREAYRNIVDKQCFNRLEELIGRSLFTMYSRLANVQLPSRSQRRKWTKSDWQRHCEWLKKRALPKKPKDFPMLKRKKVPLNDLMESIYTLSKPRNPSSKFSHQSGYKSSIKLATLIYNPTERIIKLAEPKHPKSDEEDEEFEPFHVNPRALTFVPTDRIKTLATPKTSPPQIDGLDLTTFGVLKRALKAKLNQRTLELSKPKDKTEDDEDMEEKPLVNPKALKAKPTPRIIQLAQPRRNMAEKANN